MADPDAPPTKTTKPPALPTTTMAPMKPVASHARTIVPGPTPDPAADRVDQELRRRGRPDLAGIRRIRRRSLDG